MWSGCVFEGLDPDWCYVGDRCHPAYPDHPGNPDFLKFLCGTRSHKDSEFQYCDPANPLKPSWLMKACPKDDPCHPDHPDHQEWLDSQDPAIGTPPTLPDVVGGDTYVNPDVPDTTKPDAWEDTTVEPDVPDTTEPDIWEDTYVEPDACVPSCTEGFCDDDGCGGTCACNEGLVCNEDSFICVPPVCVPVCFNDYCGDDSCGNPCYCGEDEVCNDETLVCEPEACVPNCPDEFCGGDGCGELCSCSDGSTCNVDSSTCEPDPCIPICPEDFCGGDGCGELCSCGEGEICNDDLTCEPEVVVPTVMVEAWDASEDSLGSYSNVIYFELLAPTLGLYVLEEITLELYPTNLEIGGVTFSLYPDGGNVVDSALPTPAVGNYFLEYTPSTEWSDSEVFRIRTKSGLVAGPTSSLHIIIGEFLVTDEWGNPIPVSTATEPITVEVE